MKKFFLIVTLLLSNSLLAKQGIAPSFIEVFNQGSRLEVIDYLSNNMSKSRIERYGIDNHVGVFLNSQNTFGNLEVIKFLPPSNGNERVEVLSKIISLS